MLEAENREARQSMYSGEQRPVGPENLMSIIEEEESMRNRDSVQPDYEEQKSGHIQDAQNLIDKIADMNQKRNMRGSSMRPGSMMQNQAGSARANNRMSMYRRPTQMQNPARASGATMHVKNNRDSNKRSMTIYNPFGFNKEITDGRHAKKVREVSMSLDGPIGANSNIIAPSGGQMRTE